MSFLAFLQPASLRTTTFTHYSRSLNTTAPFPLCRPPNPRAHPEVRATATDPRTITSVTPTRTTAEPPAQRIVQPELLPTLDPPRPKLKTKTGIVLVNIGTPTSVSIPDVREYLRQFLGDQRVVDLNPLVKWFILNLFILQTRPKESAGAYASIWNKQRGSPLLYHSQDLAVRLETLFNKTEKQTDEEKQYIVKVGMQYCEPNVKDVMDDMRNTYGIDNIIIVPMYPQYASSATGAALDMIYKYASTIYNTPYLQIIPPFYEHMSYINAYVHIIEKVVGKNCENYDHLLMSFHGVPINHCERTDSTGKYCNQTKNCCNHLSIQNKNCYRAQAFTTARLIANGLNLSCSKYSVAFQSRLSAAGSIWIQPYTDIVIQQLAKLGVKKLAVVVPSFTVDCLETLEEIGIRGKEDFLNRGGEEFTLIPCLNSQDIWANALVDIVKDTCSLD